MFLFSKRLELANKFEEWAKENHIKNCPLSVITWLYTQGLLDEEKIADRHVLCCRQTNGQTQMVVDELSKHEDINITNLLDEKKLKELELIKKCFYVAKSSGAILLTSYGFEHEEELKEVLK